MRVYKVGPREVDLHVHTTASDGTDSPRRLVERAKTLGLKAVAITDHDTIDGVEEAQTAGKEFGVEVIAGIEISSSFNGGELHMLGYFVQQTETFMEQLTLLKSYRSERNPLMVAKLQELGYDITLEEVSAKSGGKIIGRPHFAQVLVEKGYFPSMDQVFAELLSSEGKAYVPKEKLTPVEAIEFIRKGKGIPVLAHPGYLHTDNLSAYVAQLKTYGLQGMEVYYGGHDYRTQLMLERIAQELELVATGGSDYHGQNKLSNELGKGNHNLWLNYTIVERLKECFA